MSTDDWFVQTIAVMLGETAVFVVTIMMTGDIEIWLGRVGVVLAVVLCVNVDDAMIELREKESP